jgi:hypothetical protein
MKIIILTLLSLSSVFFTFAQLRGPVFSKFQAPSARVKNSIPFCAHEYYTWDDNNSKWNIKNRDVYQYGSNKEMILGADFDWPGGVKTLIDSTQVIYTYNANNQLILSVNQSWNVETNSWVNASQAIDTYDVNSRIINETFQKWNLSNSTWLNDSETDIIYNDNISTTTGKIWINDANEWQNSWQNIGSYNNMNNLDSIVFQNWDNNSDSWINNYKTIWIYDNGGKVINYITQNWKTNTNNWINDHKETYTVDVNNNTRSTILQLWDSVTESWNNSTNTITQYSGNGDVTSILYQHWTWENNQWNDDFRNNYTYDLYSNKTIVNQRFDTNTNSWKDFSKEIFYYDCTITGIVDENEYPFNVFPNPSNGQFNFNGLAAQSIITIYDSEGKQVNHTVASEKTTTIDLRGKCNGIYYYSLLNKNGNTKSGKLILK